ncbi:hypothetical protein BD289DRAFT_65961 [Coniella lustricola]|uniref:C2H2-type domain-containing protein n=1 Tax=Coniella lustricola TaxID=2025994 RepID=A0A2T3AHW0_9PEZI|nr:hypothetical protein BD289DRAFT_65961 [Coniella lustricola]
MSSLQSIMNLDQDEVHSGTSSTSSLMVKKDKDSPAPPSGFRDQDRPSSTSSGHVMRPGFQHQTSPSSSALPLPTVRLPATDTTNTVALLASSPSPSPLASSPSLYSLQQLPVDRNQSFASSDPHGKRPAESSAITSVSAFRLFPSSPSSSSTHLISEQNSPTIDAMDHHGYGSALGSSSSMSVGAGPGGYPPNQSRRHMGSPNADMPVKLTPITGRVSRAKKGVPVHVCDTCNPPKTFTRAEHLRRHQLGHQTPRFPCNRCDKAFHRQDLLTRHQQRHEQEGDQSSRGGDRRGSTESMTSGMQHSNLNEVYQRPHQSHGDSSSRWPFSAPGTPPTGGGSQRTASPPAGDHEDVPGFTLSSERQQIYSTAGSVGSSPEPVWNNSLCTPRNSDLGMGTSVLLELPGLIASNDCSPWASSTEESGSTSSDQPRIVKPSLEWRTSPHMVPVFTPVGRCGMSTTASLADMTSTYYGVSAPYPDSTHMVSLPPSYISTMGNPLMNGFADEHTQSLLDPAITMSHAIHQRSPVRSQTPPSSLSTLGHTADILATPAPLSHRIDSMVQTRQKDTPMHNDDVDMSMAFASGSGSSHWTDNHSDGGKPIGEAGLSRACGYAVGTTTTLTSLSRAIRNAIPSYLDVYWDRFNVLYPIIHRNGFQGEQILRCAMAAVATQYMAGKEDRIRGNQLHEFAWQEAKRQPHRNLQVMQAIFLCEYFARFRGRKAAVRPSKQFVDLFSRVSGSESLVSLPVSRVGHSSSFHISHSGSSSSAWSPQSPESLSASSPKDQFKPEPIPFFFPVGSISPQQLLSSVSSVYDPRLHSYDDGFLDNTMLSYSLDGHEQSYSNTISPQVLDQNPTLYDSAVSFGAASFGHHQQHDMSMTQEQRWHTWLEAEGRRRLLAACFNLDGHAAVLYQQPRTRDNIDPTTIPLMGPSEPLWAASTADEWAALLDASPAMSHAQFLPPLDTIMPQHVPNFSVVDQASILNAAALAMPRRYMSRSGTDKTDVQGSTSPDELCTPTAESYLALQLNDHGAGDRLTLLFSQCIFPYLPAATADVYVALQHTPLQDLLVVSGDSWVFSQKVTGAPTFLEHQKRLKIWNDSRSTASPASAHPTSPIDNGLQGMSSAKATVHAARALLVFLAPEAGVPGDEPPRTACISTYWAMYVCALIIWAFGHKGGRASVSGSATSPTNKSGSLCEGEATNWLHLLAGLEQPEHVARVKNRKEASSAVISMVRQRLEADCTGNRSRLFLDALGVLKKLEERVNWRWF